MARNNRPTVPPDTHEQPQARGGALDDIPGGTLPGDDEIAGDEEAGEEMESNSQTLHQGVHDGIEAELHFGGEIHDDEQFEENYRAPSPLEAPPERPGFVQRWIRISLLGKSDAKNQSSQGQNGWKPRALSSVPVGQRGRYPTIRDSRTGGEFMVNGDLILCEMAERRFKQMQEHYRSIRDSRIHALDADIAGAAIRGAENHGFGAPKVVTRKSSISTRTPIVDADQ